MTQQEAKNYVEGAFQALKDRGWFLKTGLVPTGVTDREIAEFEAESELKLPTLLKAFLKSYRMDFDLWGIIHEVDFDTRPWPISLNTSVKELRINWAVFCEIAADYGAAPEQYGHFLPIGMWDSEFLVWDLSRREDQVDAEDWRELGAAVFPPRRGVGQGVLGGGRRALCSQLQGPAGLVLLRHPDPGV